MVAAPTLCKSAIFVRAPLLLLLPPLLLLLLVSPPAANSDDMSAAERLPRPAKRIADEPESVWVEFIQLALEHKPLNLGQGFPDFAAPEYLVESLHNATSGREPHALLNNQYTRSFGHPRLVKALVDYYRRHRDFARLEEPNSQVLVTVGAYEALFCALLAFVEPGDEVLIVEPAFDAYAPIVELAQGRNVFVPLRPRPNASRPLSSADFALELAELEAKVSARTRVLVLNTPNNPLGKMYSRQELRDIAALCVRHNLLVVADEVYEQMYYAPERHLSIALEPGMWRRTITVGSAGKTFSVTGWKVGWALGPPELIKFLQLVHQTAVYTVATPLQESLARALERESALVASGRDYWSGLRADLSRKRRRMADILSRAQMSPVVPQGGYFMLANFERLAAKFPEFAQVGERRRANSSGAGDTDHFANTRDFRFARWLSARKKLQGIPASAFYSAANKHLAASLIRFCFIKDDATLDKLEELIEREFGAESAKL